MREQLAEREQEGREHRRELLTKVDEMTGVIVFFDGLLIRGTPKSFYSRAA